MQVRFNRARPHGNPLPSYQSSGAAGLDLAAALDGPLDLEPGTWAVVPTGFSVEIPPGFEGQVRPRSGLAAASGVTVLNAPGTIDSDYRGELKVVLINLGRTRHRIENGARIAQLVVAPVARVQVAEVPSLTPTSRGDGGFGSTGGG